MKRLIVLVAFVAAGCAYHAPTEPTPVVVAPSTAAASIRLVGASRPDRTTDVVATVLTSSGAFVVGAPLTLETSAGSLSTTSGMTDSAGAVRSVLTNGTTAIVRATASGVTSELTVNGVSPIADPPSVPTPPVQPNPTTQPLPLTVRLLALGQPAGSETTFSLQTTGIARATWTFGDGGSVTTTAPSTSHVYDTAGNYTAGVTVTDTLGRTASTTTIVAVPVVPAAQPAPASFVSTINCPKVTSGLTQSCNVAITMNGALLPSSDVTRVDWDWGDGQIDINQPSPVKTHTYASVGTYTVFATVTGAPPLGVSQSATTSTSVTMQ